MPPPDASPATPAPAGVAGLFPALRHRNFRLFWFGQILSLTGTWMQITAQGWLVLELTDSEFLLGLVSAASSAPILLFTLWAGVVADRYDKRRIILVAQSFALAVALVLAVLTGTGRITVESLLVLVFLLGTASAFEVPTRQSFFVDLVGRPDLTNAIAMNSAAFNGSRIIGPAIAGVLIGAAGVAACFYLNAVSFLAVLVALLAMRLPAWERPAETASAWQNLREGFAYIHGDRLVRTLVGLVAAAAILAFPFTMLLPVFARDVLHVGARGLGALLAASGAGALAGGVALAAVSSRVRRGPLLLGSAVAFTTLLIGFALSPFFGLSLVLLVGVGFAMILNTATVNSLIQSLVPDRLRGRVMSVYVFMFLGMGPVGSLQAGTLAHWLGAPAALAIGAAALLATVLAVWMRVPELRAVG